MRFEMTRSPSTYYQVPTWQVEKVLTPGERFLVARFENEYRAHLCLESLKASFEVSQGAEVCRDA